MVVTQNLLRSDQRFIVRKVFAHSIFFAWGLTPLRITYWKTQKKKTSEQCFLLVSSPTKYTKKISTANLNEYYFSLSWQISDSAFAIWGPSLTSSSDLAHCFTKRQTWASFRWLVVIQPLPGFKSAWSVEVFMMLCLKQTGFILDMFKVQKKNLPKLGSVNCTWKVFGLMLQQGQGVLPPGKSAAKSYTKKNRRLANTPIQLAIGSHQPGTWIQ